MNLKSQFKPFPIFLSFILIMGFAYFVFIGGFFTYFVTADSSNYTNSSSDIIVEESPVIVPDDPILSDTREIGYEFLNDSSVVHIWNTQDDYFFEKDSGIQLTNHYEDYWTKNVFCIGYYYDDTWNKIKCADELSNFNKNIETDNLTYVNATLWKDVILNIEGNNYDFRLGINYYLGLNNDRLKITIYGKNIDENNISVPLSFAWITKDIKINNDYENDKIVINGTDYWLNESLNLNFTNMGMPYYILYDGNNFLEEEKNYVRLEWDNNLDYKVSLKNVGEYNSQVSLGINAGIFNTRVEKSTILYWIDPSIEKFYEDFESGGLATNWEQDAQNSWAENGLSACGSSFSAEIDGATTNGWLQTISNFSLDSYDDASLSAQIRIDAGLDTGEFVCMDYSCDGGATWNRDTTTDGGAGGLCQDGDQDIEDTWRTVLVNISSVCSGLPSNFKTRFRGTISGSNEDGNVDCVNISAIGETAPTFSNLATNDSNIFEGDSVNHSVTISASPTQYLFSWNASGDNCDTWVNSSWTDVSGESVIGWNVSTIPYNCRDKTIGWKFYANNSIGISESITESYFINITEEDIQNDDGSGATYFSNIPVGTIYASKFTPVTSGIPYQIRRATIQLYNPNSVEDTDFRIHVYGDTLGEDLVAPFNVTFDTYYSSWQDIDLTGLGIYTTSENFYVGVEWLTASGDSTGGPFIMDDGSEVASSSYSSYNAGSDWLYKDVDNYMIRASVANFTSSDIPQFSNYWDDNNTIIGSGLGHFNVTVENTNGTVILEINNEEIIATNLSSNVYNVSYNFTTYGTYNYRWYSWGDGAIKLDNYSESRDYVVNVSYGTLYVEILEPIHNSNWNYNDNNLTINATVTCVGGECGTVSALARYGTSSPDTDVNTTEGAIPFYIYASNTLSDGLISYYKLDEISGAVIDSHGSNNGTNIDGVPNQPGKINTAYGFNNYQNTNVPDSDSLSTPEVSASFWFNSNTNSTYQIIMGKMLNTESSGWNVKTRTDGGMWFCVGWQSDADCAVSNTTFNANEWNHYTGTYNGSELKIYLNGQLVGNTTSDVDLTNVSTADLQFGEDQTTIAEYFNGEIDEVAIFNRSLIDSEVSDLYANNGGISYGNIAKKSGANPQSQSLSKGESWNVSWTLNVTTASEVDYLIDVLFNSTSYPTDITANNTADRLVNLNPSAPSGDQYSGNVSLVITPSDSIDKTGAFDRENPLSTIINDAMSRLGDFFKTTSNDLSFSIIADRFRGLFRNPSDTINISDILNRLFLGFTLVSNSLTIDNSVDRKLDINRNTQQGISFSDILNRLLLGSRNPSDTLTFTDETNRFRGLFEDPSDTLTFTDDTGRIYYADRTPSQTLSISDILDRLFSGFRDTSDTLSFTDETGKLREVNIDTSQSFSLSDILNRLFLGSRTPTEDITITDDTGRTYFADRDPSQSFSISEILSRLLFGLRTPLDTLTLIDDTEKLREVDRIPSQSLTLSEEINRLFSGTRNQIQAISITDDTGRIYFAIRDTNQSFIIIDSTTGEYVDIGQLFTINTSQSFSISDILNRLFLGSRTPTDTLTFTDSTGRIYYADRITSQSISIDDIIDRLFFGDRASSSLITITDSTGKLREVDISVDQQFSISDILSRLFLGFRDTSDTLSFTDATGRIYFADRTSPQTFSISDILNRLFLGSRDTADTLTFTDSTDKLREVDITTTQTISISDIVNRLFLGTRQTDDILTFTDSTGRIYYADRTPSQTLSISDILNRLFFGDRTPTDTLIITDSIGKLREIDVRTSQTFSVSDILNRLFLGSRVSSDTLTFTDETGRIYFTDRTASQSFSISDIINRLSLGSRTPSDTLTFTDETGKLREVNIDTPQSISIIDTLSRLFFGFRDQSDTLTFTDETGRTYYADRTTSQSFSISDTISRLFFGFRDQSDTLTITDSVDKLRGVDVDTFQSFSIDDIINRLLFGSRTPSDNLTITDETDRTYFTDRTSSQSISISDIVNRLFLGSRTPADDLIITDSTDRGYLGLRNPTQPLKFTIFLDSTFIHLGDIFSINVSDSFIFDFIINRVAILERGINQDITIDLIANRASSIFRNTSQIIDFFIDGYARLRFWSEEDYPFNDDGVETPPVGSSGSIEPSGNITVDLDFYNRTIMCEKVNEFLELRMNYTQDQRESLKNSLALIFGFGIIDDVLDEYLENFEYHCPEYIDAPEPDKPYRYLGLWIVLSIIILMISFVIIFLTKGEKTIRMNKISVKELIKKLEERIKNL